MIGHGGLLSVFLHSPDKGFWTKPSSAILGSDNPQSNKTT